MPKVPLDRNDRLELQYRRLGRRDPVCLGCGESNPFCLELHHIGGQKLHADTGIVCRNCHRKLSDEQHDHARKSGGESEDTLSTIGHYLMGLADFLLMIAKAIQEFGRHLIGQAHATA